MQDLSGFEVPGGFRGGGAIKVQLWWAVQATLFRWSPQVMYRWRAFLLRMFGAKIGKNVVIRPSVKITYPWKLTLGDYAWVGDDAILYTLGDITIGAHAVISQKSYLCTGSHDYASQYFDINATPIVVGAKCWLATDVFVAPGVTIGDGTVVGARSSVFKSLPANVVCRGNPAVVTRERVEKVTP
ncbi:colanic acid biosynthesis acetyltransferase WcaF [Citrobacter portucalensis]|uniref:colanic acid biosynthesis acetyltransferase WcaF n=1 Tax=Citrobacter portucalensis TaxID=1639133 RepID=UPI002B23E0D3|nr:colanic acid biosynthesis acetyltransferase WcaF [Citrobacter portucalensis]MEB0773463.1 colanic acid biosynthesis acetyltransferase WcaF [Citrobacter portucalensis]MEB0840256.1 colanic acid biosynthesis acetyltransferase WcaF [Citrobacter portucalensis]